MCLILPPCLEGTPSTKGMSSLLSLCDSSTPPALMLFSIGLTKHSVVESLGHREPMLCVGHGAGVVPTVSCLEVLEQEMSFFSD